MQLGLLGRALHVGDGLERLVLDADLLGGAARLLGVLGGDERDRLAEVAHAVDREHRLVGELEPVALLAGNVLVREHGMDAGHRDRLGDVDRDGCARARAGCERVWPQSIPGATRSLENANSPLTFGTPSARGTLSPIRPTSSRGGATCVIAVVRSRGRPPRPPHDRLRPRHVPTLGGEWATRHPLRSSPGRAAAAQGVLCTQSLRRFVHEPSWQRPGVTASKIFA